jgi:hypothetical protein
MVSDPPFPPIGGSDPSSQSSQIPHCPHCGGSDLKVIENGKRYQCKAVQSALFLARLSGNKSLATQITRFLCTVIYVVLPSLFKRE